MLIKLPEKLKRFGVWGLLLLALLLFAGGFYFRYRSLTFSLPAEAVGEGTVSGARTGLPPNFPPDLPLFEPAEILSSLESQKRIQLTLQTEAPAERVLKFYRQRMEEGGWRLTDSLTFLKDGRWAQLTITSGPRGSNLIILSATF